MSASPITVPAGYSTQQAVQATVEFADVLGLPLDLDQLHHSLLGVERSLLDTSLAVDELVTKGQLSRRNEMVCLSGREELFDLHTAAARRAAETWPTAKTWTLRIGRIPFVRMVAVTGSLALEALGDTEAINLWIVVRPRRLWITRLLITRTVRAASRQRVTLRPVYLATTRTPELTSRSLSVAWELTHLAAVVGRDLARTIRRSNDWVDDLFPNAGLEGNLQHVDEQAPSSKQRWAETLLLLPPFRVLENVARTRQIASLETGEPQSTTQRFTTEVCDEHLSLQASVTDSKWRAKASQL